MNINKLILSFFKRCYALPSSIVQNYIRTVHMQNMYISQSNVVAMTHKETFGKYKNKYISQEIAIIATGPSLNQYKPIENLINIGVNKAIFNDKISLDYYFSQDYWANNNYINHLIEYKNVTKFYGQVPLKPFGCKEINNDNIIMPESLILKHGAYKYYTYGKWLVTPLFFNPDIDKTWLADGGSVIFSAMQFALFTNPKRIYLVGCDCSSGHFDEKSDKKIQINKTLYKSWKELKKFADIYYPETEIISVNPVGLKGLFKDMYQ